MSAPPQKLLEPLLFGEAEVVAADLIPRAHTVFDVERVRGIARRMLRVHALRAGDALQLGAALA